LGGLQFDAGPGKYFMRHISKITRVKWTGGETRACFNIALQKLGVEKAVGKAIRMIHVAFLIKHSNDQMGVAWRTLTVHSLFLFLSVTANRLGFG
jgi:hypothetical protein